MALIATKLKYITRNVCLFFSRKTYEFCSTMRNLKGAGPSVELKYDFNVSQEKTGLLGIGPSSKGRAF